MNMTGPLKEPKKDLNFYVELIKGKFKIFYLYLVGFK